MVTGLGRREPPKKSLRMLFDGTPLALYTSWTVVSPSGIKPLWLPKPFASWHQVELAGLC